MKSENEAACRSFVEAVAWAEPSGSMALFLTNIVVSSTHFRLIKNAVKSGRSFSQVRADWQKEEIREGIIIGLREYCVESLGFSYSDTGTLTTISNHAYESLIVTSNTISGIDADEVLDRAAELGGGHINCYMCDKLLDSPLSPLNRSERRKIPLDHVWPRSLGGISTPQNLLPICEPCNTLKSDRSSWDVYGVVQDFTHATGGNNAAALLQQSLLRRAATKIAETKYITLKDAFEELGPYRELAVLDSSEPRTYFNLVAHDTSKLASLL